MASPKTQPQLKDETSCSINISSYDTKGFSTTFPLRRHRFEVEANAGSHDARQDWAMYVAPTDKFGGCNPINGNFTAVVLPFCNPERLRLVAYILEYAFLYDNIIETDSADTENAGADQQILGQPGLQPLNPALRRKQMQAKMILQLTSTDKVCSERVLDVWKTMDSTTLRDKEKKFGSLKEYVDFRIVDTGAPFVESVMLFGMGMTLTKEEDEQLADVVYPCYAALGLANDYFSFDREYEQFQESDATSLTNAVWHYMQWQNVDIDAAKDLVRKATTKYEEQFLERCAEFRQTRAPISPKLDQYLTALQHQISGNVVWSLNCPRYHPSFRYDPNAGIENTLIAPCKDAVLECNNQSRTSSVSEPTTNLVSRQDSSNASRRSSASSFSSWSTSAEVEKLDPLLLPLNSKLEPKLVQEPFSYTSTLPSKGLRDAFIDALNVWLDVEDDKIAKIKWIINHLHTASLMLDDIQDCSSLRRGKPAAYKVFGIAQTINSANLAILEAINATRELQQPKAMEVVMDELQNLHVGQGYDLCWTRHITCPTEEEYLEMVRKKTGGLFRLLARLMMIGQTSSEVTTYIEDLVTFVGVYFQIRDDYQNLNSTEYSVQKGFCEDLDEGKLSFPLIHCLNSNPTNSQVREILQSRKDSGSLPKESKLLLLHELERSGSMNYTNSKLKHLQEQIKTITTKAEEQTDRKNWVLRLFLQKLSI